ncbi:hypothetical protein HN51_062046 [Arachis hypogaea]
MDRCSSPPLCYYFISGLNLLYSVLNYLKKMASTQANASENLTNILTSQSGSTARIASKRKVAKNALGRGVYKLKHHLARTQKDVGACTAVNDEVKKQMWNVVSGFQVNLMKKISMDGASPGEATKEAYTTGEKRKGKN